MKKKRKEKVLLAEQFLSFWGWGVGKYTRTQTTEGRRAGGLIDGFEVQNKDGVRKRRRKGQDRLGVIMNQIRKAIWTSTTPRLLSLLFSSRRNLGEEGLRRARLSYQGLFLGLIFGFCRFGFRARREREP